MQLPTVVSLFSGIGAFDLAAQRAGFKTVAFSEICPFAIRVFKRHWPNAIGLGDIRLLHGQAICEIAGRVDVMTAGFPCFTAGHLVLTERGYAPIESLSVGDRVVTHRGRLRPIVRVGSAIKPVGLLKGSGIRVGHTVTLDHPYLAVDWRMQSTRRQNKAIRIEHVGNEQWVAASEMVGKQWCALTEYQPVEAGSPTPRLTPRQAMLLAGMYLGDGWVGGYRTKRKKVVLLALNDRKYEFFLAHFPGVPHFRTNDRTCRKTILCDTNLAEWLIDQFGKGAANKRIPAWVLGHPDRDALMQGYVATDGCFKGKGAGVSITTISSALAFGFCDLSVSLGFVASCNVHNVGPMKVIEGRTVNQRPFWTALAIPRWKSIRSRVYHGKLLRGIRSFTPCGERTVYNIEVADDHSYVVQGAIVHNCQDISVAGKRLGLDGGNRSVLFYEIMRLVREMTTYGQPPRFLVLENVPALLFSGGGKDFSSIINSIRKCGALDIAWRVLDGRYAGVPQQRRRLFIVADFRKECAGKVLFDQNQVFGDHESHTNKKKISTEDRMERLVEQDGTVTTLWPRIAKTCTRRDYKGPRNEEMQCTIVMHHVNDDKEWYTIRRLTPTEFARLMGFPDDWITEESDTKMYQLYGNSAVVPLLEQIFTRIHMEL